MSDSFADLWNSSVPTKPTQAPKLGSVTTSTAQKRPQHDVFSLLSSTGSSSTNSRPITPSTISQQKPIAKPPPKASSGGDAFSGLFDGSLPGGSSNGARMTIAERAAQVEKERLASLQRHQQSVKQTSSAWDGLDSLGNTPSPSLPKTSNSSQDDDWGFGTAAPIQPTPKPKIVQKPMDDDDWGLGDLAAAAVSQPQARTPASQAIWDLDEFAGASSSAQPSPPIITTHQRSDSPGDFDFGNREDALLGDDSNDEDDILGALSKPVDSIPKRKSPANERSTPSPLPTRGSSTSNKQSISRPISPPPHILGRIVEMGFSVQQARIALASTDTGLDVEAALETLLSNGAASSSTPPPQRPSPDQAPRGKPPRTAARLIPHDRNTPSPSNSQLERDKDRNIQDQADKLLLQASEIGLSVFNKASSFWKEGKERVQKAYEERAASAAGSSTGENRGNGRPRWMQEPAGGDADRDRDDGWRDESGGGGFSDDVLPQRPNPATKPKPTPKPEPPVADLFSNEPVAYQSPFRRGKPQQSAPAPALASASVPRSRQRAPSPIRITQRQNVVSASNSSIARSTKHKDLGGEKFKLGQYGDAEAAYTSAIACLPASHLLLIPLYNNRALSRLKTGDHRGAVEDATTVTEIIGVGYHPAREAKVEAEQEGASVDLADALVKALKRRAEAWEGREKWEEAGKDWEALAALEWAKPAVRGDAVRGVGRCRRMVQAADKGAGGGGGGQPPAPAKPKAKPPPPRPAPSRRPQAPSQALENLRTVNNAAEAEDQQRHDLKDKVDAKLLAWKGGKEANIRALLGSLDTVLWPELGLQKVGMADLVSSSQVKIKYTRTIAKLHPDKLNSGNTTVEQRMLANAVFGALNEAWNSFKQ
ncbi:hypothetical protein BDZ94DRAFT_1217783 [Collybia nuda]|uniref:UBA domain-containing protein n=1 Tax=Collybia nuda TaxID=64659 RepID=A0A9P5Y7M9_9AGAR|nr:hypothetical protein BDZ94DRAFT_1217783 [Collybia nuda]